MYKLDKKAIAIIEEYFPNWNSRHHPDYDQWWYLQNFLRDLGVDLKLPEYLKESK